MDITKLFLTVEQILDCLIDSFDTSDSKFTKFVTWLFKMSDKMFNSGLAALSSIASDSSFKTRS